MVVRVIRARGWVVRGVCWEGIMRARGVCWEGITRARGCVVGPGRRIKGAGRWIIGTTGCWGVLWEKLLRRWFVSGCDDLLLVARLLRSDIRWLVGID